MEIKVKGCNSCPFVEHNAGATAPFYAMCLAPAEMHQGRYKVDNYFLKSKSPNYCPLKKVKILTIKHI